MSDVIEAGTEILEQQGLPSGWSKTTVGKVYSIIGVGKLWPE